ncbi:MAG: 23S rRNA (adenine(2503)-C(2))-methyltransferase RlmN [bacterium]|nr:23S rRNA (adenine(2503)-C(2))-methyltransferase RlmN [bacterium]
MTRGWIGLSTDELVAEVAGLGEPGYRGKQLATWLYRKNRVVLDEMTDLPRGLREKLATRPVGELSLVRDQVATDGTRKFLFDTLAGGMVESVFMPSAERSSVCVSTQVGCAVACAFCETGLSGFQRDLSAGEIVEQVLAIQRLTGERVTHVVFMGMGEPLFNMDATLKAVALLNGEVGIGMRHLTISTSGVVPAIDRLAEHDLQLTLAISLHAAEDGLRDVLVPLNRRFPLEQLKEAAQRYENRTGRRITIEYVLLDGVNDQRSHAEACATWLRGIHAHVNLIPFNATEAAFAPSRPEAIRQFRQILEGAGFPVTVRVERGAEIAAACGQLRRQALKAAGEIVPLRKRGAEA